MEPLDATIASSPDIVADNIAKLRELFPECFTEGSDEDGPRFKVDFDALKETLGDYVEDKEERYSFTWNGKARARRIAQTPSTGTLRPCPEESVNWDTTQNLFIEGDNLEVLKLLQKSYHRRVKMIYIDPPYNTGKEFIYPDKFQDNLDTYLRYTGQIDDDGFKLSSNSESSGRYHTNWLNMMMPRLRLARNLLRDDGLFFISIDDNEVANLRRLCDEIFGEENFHACVSRVTGTPTGGGNDAIVNEIDYVLVYARSSDASIAGMPLTPKDEAIYDKEDERGRYLIRSLRRTGGEDRREDRPSMYYPVVAPDGTEVFPMGPTGYESRWICGRDKYKEMQEAGLIEWAQVNRNGSEEWQVYQKFYLEGRLKQPSNLWKNLEGNKKATRDLKAMFDGKKVFDFPKPVDLVRRMMQLATCSSGDIVLDFFAGSGVTAHAVLDENKANGRDARFICVQLPEPVSPDDPAAEAGYHTIADVCRERIRRAIAQVYGDSGNEGFRSYRLASSNVKAWDADFASIEDAVYDAEQSVKSERSASDILSELLLKFGIDLCVPIERHQISEATVFSVAAGALVVCLDEEVTLGVAEGIAALKEELNPEVMRVVFRDSGFKDDVVKTNAVQILKQAGLSDEHIRSI